MEQLNQSRHGAGGELKVPQRKLSGCVGPEGSEQEVRGFGLSLRGAAGQVLFWSQRGFVSFLREETTYETVPFPAPNSNRPVVLVGGYTFCKEWLRAVILPQLTGR